MSAIDSHYSLLCQPVDYSTAPSAVRVGGERQGERGGERGRDRERGRMRGERGGERERGEGGEEGRGKLGGRHRSNYKRVNINNRRSVYQGRNCSKNLTSCPTDRTA